MGRTMQATNRLYYDVLPLLAGDERVQTYFTFDESSEFGDGVPRFLDQRQVKLIPWHIATDPARFHCDVTVSASANVNLRQLPGRKLVMAHGAGSHKYRAKLDRDELTVSSLSPSQLVFDGELIPSVVALAGPDQVERLRYSCPEAVGRAVVTGDVCAERLHVSLPHRDRYRRYLGLHEGQRLVVLSSTWGPDALIKQHPSLADQLLSELPADEYRVAFVLHPNSWDRHGRPDVHGWLATAKRAGLAIVPPEEGWRAVIVASDVVIGDHGSVGFYAADLGRPLLLAAYGDAEVPSDSPAAALRQTVPRLDTEADLTRQLNDAITGHAPGRYRDITSRALDPHGSAADRMRTILYQLLGLATPTQPPLVEPLPLPEVDWTPATTFHIHPVPETSPPLLVRFPVTSRQAARQRPYRDRVLTVDAAEPDSRRRDSASVLTWTESALSMEEAANWAEGRFAEHPGATVAVVRLSHDKCFLHLRGNGISIADSQARLEPATLGAAIYLWSLESEPPGILRYRQGGRTITVTLSPVDG